MPSLDPTGAPPRPGDVVAGKYRVERVLGSGGMGVVVAAHHLQLDEKVAIKFLLPEASADGEAVARFLREARAAARVKNDHVVRVLDVGELPNGAPYLVMEHLEGADLAAQLEASGPMPIERAVHFVLQACEALADAHARGIVHRDLKPGNLFCTERTDGSLWIKVLDFGISKVTTPGAAGHDVTSTSALMGSPLYMSPEQMKAARGVDARADIWSLGVLLFEMLTGEPPFQASAVTELAIRVATEPAPTLRQRGCAAPPGLESVLARCLAKDREARYQTVGELAAALAEFGPRDARISVERVLGTLRNASASRNAPASGTDMSAGVATAPTLLDEKPVITASSGWGRTRAPTRARGRAVLAIGAFAFSVLVVAGGVFVFRKVLVPASGASAAVATPLSIASEPSAHAPELDAPLAPAPPAIPKAAPAASVLLVAPALSSAPAASVKPPQVATHARPPAPHAAPASSAPPASPKPTCNPPYVIDSNGDRQYKPECLQ